MRIVIHLNDYDDSAEAIEHDVHKVHNPRAAGDSRAVVDGVYAEWFPGGGNIHVTDDRVTQIYETMGGDVMVEIAGERREKIENAEIATVYPNESTERS